jgi:hypothetical protein
MPRLEAADPACQHRNPRNSAPSDGSGARIGRLGSAISAVFVDGAGPLLIDMGAQLIQLAVPAFFEPVERATLVELLVSDGSNAKKGECADHEFSSASSQDCEGNAGRNGSLRTVDAAVVRERTGMRLVAVIHGGPMTGKSTPTDSPRRDPDPRSAFGNPDLAKAAADGSDRSGGEVVGPAGGEHMKDELDPPVIDANDADELPVPIAKHRRPSPED